MHPRKRVQKIIDECNQMIIDVHWWNNNRLEEQPLDCEQEKVILSLANNAASLWDAGNIESFQVEMRKITDYVEQCEASQRS